jgi:hypothetical protein
MTGLLWTARDFVLGHAAWLLLLSPALLFIPGALSAFLAFARTAIGRLIIVGAICGVIGWEVRASFDDGVQARRALAAANARAVELERQARASAEIATEAAERERAAMTESEERQTRIESYESELEKRPACDDVLGPDDVERLRGLAHGANPPKPPRRPFHLR